MGATAFLLDLLVEFLIEIRWHATEKVVKSTESPILGLLVILSFSLLFALIAMSLTSYVSPTAAGSGVAETMGILNGV